jgi:hypothetical protein
MKMLLSRFPEEIVQKYNLNALAVDGWVYIEIRKDMYRLKKAGLLANHLDIIRHTTPQDYGCIKRGQSLSHLSWTISQSSTWAGSTRIISETLC